MPISTHTNDNTITISVQGRFDFTAHNDFREAYSAVNQTNIVILNLAECDYLDSSALGMLLLLREHMGEKSGNVTIAGATPDVKQILAIANFDTIFNVS